MSNSPDKRLSSVNGSERVRSFLSFFEVGIALPSIRCGSTRAVRVLWGRATGFLTALTLLHGCSVCAGGIEEVPSDPSK